MKTERISRRVFMLVMLVILVIRLLVDVSCSIHHEKLDMIYTRHLDGWITPWPRDSHTERSAIQAYRIHVSSARYLTPSKMSILVTKREVVKN